MKYFAVISIIIAIFALGFRIGRKSSYSETIVSYKRDTIVFRDTLRIKVPIPERIYITRIDTVTLHTIDSVAVIVPIPIETKEYRSEEFHATIEGYRPVMREITVFPKTKTIYQTEYRTGNPRFGIGLQAGYGLGSKGITPYVGVGVQYNFLTFR